MKAQILKVNDACLLEAKYEIWLNGHFYTGNISKSLKNKYVNKFRVLGYKITNLSLDQLSNY